MTPKQIAAAKAAYGRCYPKFEPWRSCFMVISGHLQHLNEMDHDNALREAAFAANSIILRMTRIGRVEQ